MNLSTWPPCRSTIGTITSNIRFRVATTWVAAALSAYDVNPRMSQNMIDTSTSTPSSGNCPDRISAATSLSM